MGRAEAVKRKAGECESQELDGLTNEIEQGFMQPGGWDACRHLLSTLARQKNAEIERMQRTIRAYVLDSSRFYCKTTGQVANDLLAIAGDIHYFLAGGSSGDQCLLCSRDLRDEIHIRANEASAPAA